MSNTPRLLEHGADDFERALLRSASRDAGSPRARARCLAAAAGASVISGTAVSAASVSSAVLVKWVGVGLVAGVTALGAVQGGSYFVTALSKRPAPNTPEKAASHRVASAAPASGSDRRSAPTSASSSRPLDTARTAPAARPPIRTDARAETADAPPPGSRMTLPDEDHALDREVALLDAARAALSAGDARRALSLLDTRQRQFPRGALGPEAGLTRVKALLLVGDLGAAEAETRRLEQSQPGGAHASRARRLIEQAVNKP